MGEKSIRAGQSMGQIPGPPCRRLSQPRPWTVIRGGIENGVPTFFKWRRRRGELRWNGLYNSSWTLFCSVLFWSFHLNSSYIWFKGPLIRCL